MTTVDYSTILNYMDFEKYCNSQFSNYALINQHYIPYMLIHFHQNNWFVGISDKKLLVYQEADIMNSKGTNRSVRRTRAKLRQGLTQLLKEKPVKDITVREISDLVDINRGTFYLHYRDIFDMVEQIENELLEEFTVIISTHPAKKIDEEALPFLKDIFQFLSDNADLCIALLGENGDLAFVNKLKDLVKNKCLQDWLTLYQNVDNYEYYFTFLLSGCIGLFETWLTTKMDKSPEEMAELTYKMITHGVFYSDNPCKADYTGFFS